MRNQSLSDPSDLIPERKKSVVLSYLVSYRNSLNPKVTLRDMAAAMGEGNPSTIKIFEDREGRSNMASAIKYAGAIGLDIVVRLENGSMPEMVLYVPESIHDADPCVLAVRQAAMVGKRREITMLELAEEVGMSYIGFMRVMNGKNKGMMKIALFEQLCKITGLSISFVKREAVSRSAAVKANIARKRKASQASEDGYVPPGYKDGDEIVLSFDSPSELHGFISKHLPVVVKGLKKPVFTSTRARNSAEDFITARLIAEAVRQKRIKMFNQYPDEA